MKPEYSNWDVKTEYTVIGDKIRIKKCSCNNRDYCEKVCSSRNRSDCPFKPVAPLTWLVYLLIFLGCLGAYWLFIHFVNQIIFQ